MSPDPEFERLLRRAREVLPAPDDAATARAREHALAGLGRAPRRRLRPTLALAAAALGAVAGGFGVGALLAPQGTAAPGPTGFGFVAERGWSVVQNGGEATAAQPAIAVSANVALKASDAGTSVPYATLLSLPPDGIVVVATFTRRGQRWHDSLFPRRELPLKLTEAWPFIDWGTQVRPQQPLGQYQLRAAVNGYNVDVNLYFGRERPKAAAVAAAQRQLDRLVVRPTSASATRAPHALPLREPQQVATGRPNVLDRTYTCAIMPIGQGYYEFEARGHSGTRANAAAWARLPFAAVSTGFVTSSEMVLNDSLVWVSAGRPASGTSLDLVHAVRALVSAQAYGTLALNTKLCTRTSERIRLSAKGLEGGTASRIGDEYDCESPRRVLLRVRATSLSPIRLSRDGAFLKARVGFKDAYVAVRSENGTPLAFVAVSETGKTRLFSAPPPRCFPE